jgi:hypothetical protein
VPPHSWWWYLNEREFVPWALAPRVGGASFRIAGDETGDNLSVRGRPQPWESTAARITLTVSIG